MKVGTIDTDTYGYLKELVNNFEDRVTITSPPAESCLVAACWLWEGNEKVAIRQDGKRTVVRIHGLSYDLAFPDLVEDKVSGRTLARVCGRHECISPDHLTDESWGVWEDFIHLVNADVSAGAIQRRLGKTASQLSVIGARANTPERKATYKTYQRRHAQELLAQAAQEKDPTKRQRLEAVAGSAWAAYEAA